MGCIIVSKLTNDSFNTNYTERVLNMCKVYGYARISTQTQNIERQIRNIRKYNDSAVIYQEAYTGTKTDRPEWIKLLKQIEKQISKGEKDITIIFDSVSRMSRNAEEGVKQYFELYNLGVNLVFLKEPHINTATYKKALSNNIAMTGTKTDIILEAINEYLMELAKEQIIIAFEQAEKEVLDLHQIIAFEQAEKEVLDLHQRTKEGIETARQQGKQIGRKSGTTFTTKKSEKAKQIILKHSIDFGGTLTDKECMQMIGGIARNSYYKYKRELKA